MDPISLAMMGVSVLGNLFSGIMGNDAGQQQKKAYDARALQEQQEAGVNAGQALQQGNEVAAHDAVQAAANGGGLGGSAMGVINMASQTAMLNARGQVYRGVTAANADLYNGDVAAADGQNKLIGGVLGAAGSVASGVMNAGFRSSILKSAGALKGDGSLGNGGVNDPLYGLAY